MQQKTVRLNNTDERSSFRQLPTSGHSAVGIFHISCVAFWVSKLFYKLHQPQVSRTGTAIFQGQLKRYVRTVMVIFDPYPLSEKVSVRTTYF